MSMSNYRAIVLNAPNFVKNVLGFKTYKILFGE